jgi:hypothetical protein
MAGGRPRSEVYPITAELTVPAVSDDILCLPDIAAGSPGAKP